MSKNQYRSSKLEKKKKNLLIQKIVFWVIAAAALIYGFVFWFNYESFAISDVTVSETKFTSRDEIQSIAMRVFDGEYMGLFSKRNLLFLPTGELRAEISRLNPAIKTVTIRRINARHIRIDVQEYEPVAKWCGATIKTAQTLCHIMNSSGQFFAQETPVFTFAVPRFFGEVSAEPLVGGYYVPIEVFEKLRIFIEGLVDMHITFDTLETEDFETFVIHTIKGPDILIDTDDDMNVVLDNLRITIEQEEINKAQLKNLIYIDVRHGNKVFYKIGVPAV
jgi:cell division septal protein FtsQ